MSLVNYWRVRSLLGVGAAAAGALGYWVAPLIGMPSAGVRAGSVLLQPSVGAAVGAVVLLVAVGLAVGIAVAGRVRADAGVFCAAFVLAGMSWRSGTMRDVFFAAPAAATYGRLAFECVMLAGVLGVAQVIVILMRQRGMILADVHRDSVEAPNANVGDLALAIALTAVLTVALAWFLVPTDQKKQALMGVGLAAFISTAALHHLVLPRCPSWPFWVGVMVGAAGTFIYAGTNPGVPLIGQVVVPPARALPLDWASFGVAASILGYWYSRVWKRAAEAEAAMA